MGKIEVRLASSEEDCKDIFALLLEMHRENAPLSLSPERLAKTVQGLVDQGRVMVATDEDGVIIGTTALNELGSWYTEDRYLVDVWFYVHPECRRSRAAILMLDAAKHIAREIGLPLYFTVHSSVDLERKKNFMLRRGFKLVAHYFEMQED